MRTASATGPVPLCIDLDGTLILADLSMESLLGAFRHQPWIIFLLPFWLLRGKAYLKAQLAARASIDIQVLPYDEKVIDLINNARAQGQPVILVTGSHQSYALQVNAHLACFDEVLASDARTNLTGHNKARHLLHRFGEGGFDYAGNAYVDLPIWQHARRAISVNAPQRLARKLRQQHPQHQHLPAAKTGLRTWLKAIRLHQWAKNGLLFVPLITAQQLLSPSAWLAVGLAFLCFGLCASATYIINDLFDLDADRHHRSKRNRPFAAGKLTAKTGVISAILLLLTGLGLASLLPWGFQLSLGTYLITTLLYSFYLKAVSSLDVLLLAGLYTLRVIAGTFAIGVALSFWLLAFSMFIFLCLAIVKRVSELLELARRETAKAANSDGASLMAKGREYSVADIQILQTLGAASGYLSVLVLALYINAPEVSLLYQTPELLWLITPLLLLWITRLWMVTARGFMDEDPIFFAIRDPETWITAVITGCILLAAASVQL